MSPTLVPAVQVTIIDSVTCDPVALPIERVRPLLERAFNPSQMGKIETGSFDGDYLVDLAPELLNDVSFSVYFQGHSFDVEVVSEAR